MADKRSTGTVSTARSQAAVTTAGTTTAGDVKITWDDAQSTAEIIDAFERARDQLIDYRFKNF